MKRGGPYLCLANAITSASLVAGFLALIAAARSTVAHAAVLVAVAAVLDSVDGAVARRTGGDTAFGANLDSLADLVSFGVVPATALYLRSLHTLPVLGLAACLGFLLAGAWRLARFPLVKQSAHFVGLPIPVAGIVVMLVLLWGPGPVPVAIATVAAAALMVSTLPFPTVSGAAAAVRSLGRGR